MLVVPVLGGGLFLLGFVGLRFWDLVGWNFVKELIMEWLIILMLVLIGGILVILEFLVFPGVNIAGVLGFICIAAAIYLGYSSYGAVAGHAILFGTIVFGAGITWYALRSSTWKRLSLDTKIDSTVEGVEDFVKAGDTGVCVGRLAPMGNVRIGEALVEAESESGYVDANREVEVVKVLKNKVIVRLKL